MSTSHAWHVKATFAWVNRLRRYTEQKIDIHNNCECPVCTACRLR